MSARTATLRELVIEDIARAAGAASMHSAARLLRRSDLTDDDLAVICTDLLASGQRDARAAGRALRKIRSGDVESAIDVLAEYCGLDAEAWTAATRDEQSAQVQS